MKKPPKTKAGKPKTKRPTQDKIPQPTTPQMPAHHRLWLVAKVLVSFFVAVIGLAASVYAIWGPPWPTNPSFSLGPPSSGAAFDVPFQVENKSVLFGFSNLKISCKIAGFAKSQLGPGFIKFGENSLFSARGTNNLPSLSSGPYTCPIRGTAKIGERDAVDLMQSAQVSFISEYDTRIFWGISHAEDGPYTWITTTVPPRWERGRPLK